MSVEVPQNNPEWYFYDFSIASNSLVADIHFTEENSWVLSLGTLWEDVILFVWWKKHLAPPKAR